MLPLPNRGPALGLSTPNMVPHLSRVPTSTTPTSDIHRCKCKLILPSSSPSTRKETEPSGRGRRHEAESKGKVSDSRCHLLLFSKTRRSSTIVQCPRMKLTLQSQESSVNVCRSVHSDSPHPSDIFFFLFFLLFLRQIFFLVGESRRWKVIAPHGSAF